MYWGTPWLLGECGMHIVRFSMNMSACVSVFVSVCICVCCRCYCTWCAYQCWFDSVLIPSTKFDMCRQPSSIIVCDILFKPRSLITYVTLSPWQMLLPFVDPFGVSKQMKKKIVYVHVYINFLPFFFILIAFTVWFICRRGDKKKPPRANSAISIHEGQENINLQKRDLVARYFVDEQDTGNWIKCGQTGRHDIAPEWTQRLLNGPICWPVTD